MGAAGRLLSAVKAMLVVIAGLMRSVGRVVVDRNFQRLAPQASDITASDVRHV